MLRWLTAGESHGPALVATLDGLPAGVEVTSKEIQAALAPYVEGRAVAGIDAPLVVTNATGSRPAEKALSKDFRRFDAGTHPSNTGKPEFADGTRGARVCALLGLQIHRTGIEVYPHAATVALFDGRRVGLGHVGDSRAYLYRGGELNGDLLLLVLSNVRVPLDSEGDVQAMIDAFAPAAP